MKKLNFIIVLLVLAASVSAHDYWEQNLNLWAASSVHRFPNSVSPDGSAKVDQVYFNETTATLVGIISTSTNKVVHLIYASPDKKYTDILWSPDGKYLAVHDSSARHSRILIYGKDNGGYKNLIVPDLRELALNELSLKASDIKSSGQVPRNWISISDLNVEVRVITNDMKNLSVNIVIEPGAEGKFQIKKDG